MTRKLPFAAVAAASLLLAACGPKESGTITLTLERYDCRQADALENADRIEVTVRGPGMEELSASGDVDAGTLSLPEIPAGADREVTVKGTSAGGTVLAIGHSGKFTVKADEDLAVPVPMAVLNRFHPTESPATGECTVQSAPRAGHSAASFGDGRTVLVGGFQLTGSDTVPLFRYLDTVELYDPATGEFRELPPLPSLCGSGTESCARAFAPAMVQKNARGRERLLVIGGEYRDEAGAPLARGELLILDPDPGTDPSTWTWKVVPLQFARRFHTATLLGNGDVLVVGGFGNPATAGDPIPVVEATELIKASSTTDTMAGTSPSSYSVARALHGAAAIGNEVVIAGGVDETGTLPLEVLQFGSAGGSRLSGALSVGVIGPTVAAHGTVRGTSPQAVHETVVAVVGGVTDPEPASFLSDPLGVFDPTQSVPVLGLEGGSFTGQAVTLTDGEPAARAVGERFPNWAPRSFACSARIDDDRLLIAGGLSLTGGVAEGGATAEVLVWVDQSQCVPKTGCEYDSHCGGGAKCVDGSCLLACTEDAECLRGSCVDRVCKSDLANPAHRCTGAGLNGCFAGATCDEVGKFDQSFVGVQGNSRLLENRAWGACSSLSADQILISGGVGSGNTVLGTAELYEIMHAGR